MANKSFNARHGISVGLNPVEFIDPTGKILGGSRISWLSNPTVTVDSPLLDATQTWNAGAIPFTALRVNITDTASNASSKLADLQIGGVSKFVVDKSGNVVISGDLTVQGTTATINTATVDVEDTNITLGKVATPTDTTANGGGITLLGTTNKTLTWNKSTASWDTSENFNLATGKGYRINGVGVLNSTTLGGTVVASSLTSVGTIKTGVWNASVIAGQYGGTGVANTGKSITLGGNLTTSGAFALTLMLGAATNVALPATGTLSTLAGTETLTNKTIGAGSTWNGTAIANSYLANSAVTIGTTSISLGASSTTLTGLTRVTSTTFVGSLNGNASSAISITVSADDTTNATRYPLFASGNGIVGALSDSGLTYNPLSQTLTTTNFVGSLNGQAASAASSEVVGVVDYSTIWTDGAYPPNALGFGDSVLPLIVSNADDTLSDGGTNHFKLRIAAPSNAYGLGEAQLAFTQNGNMWTRYAVGTWAGSTWKKVVDSSNIGSYALSPSGGTITGQLAVNSGTSNPLTLTTSSTTPWAITLTRSDLALSSSVFNQNGSAWYFQHRPNFAGNTPLDTGNYTSYVPSTTGSGASGTWPISISGQLTGVARLIGYSVSGQEIGWNGAGGIGPEVRGQAGGAAGMTFHRPGAYAANFGLNTDNQFAVGGWSMGAVSYPVIHTGNISSYVIGANFINYSQIQGVNYTNTWGRGIHVYLRWYRAAVYGTYYTACVVNGHEVYLEGGNYDYNKYQSAFFYVPPGGTWYWTQYGGAWKLFVNKIIY